MLRAPRRVFAALLMAALLSASGFHWAAFQAVAWGSMILEYSHDNGFRKAVSRTFDGKHPCTLCKRIENEKKDEKKKDIQIVATRLTLFLVQSAGIPVPSSSPWAWRIAHDVLAPGPVHSPPVPPPRRGWVARSACC